MRQLTLTDLQKKPREIVSQDAIGSWLQTASKIPFDEPLLNTLIRTLGVQDSTAVVEFNCGKAAVTANLSSSVYYQGISTEESLVPTLKAFYPSGVFTSCSATNLLNGEPSKAFGLAIVNSQSVETPHDTKYPMCTEYELPAADLELFTEVAIKSVVDGGLVALVMPEVRIVSEYFYTFMAKRATIHADIRQRGFRVIVIEPSAKPLKVDPVDSFDGLSIRVPISASDPRPLTINPWDIKMAYPKESKFTSTQLVRTGDTVGWGFASPTDAYTWVGSILEQDLVSSWTKAVEKISSRFTFDNYLRLKASGRPLWDIALLKSNISIQEAPDLAKHLERFSRRLSASLREYPDSTDISNRYWSLGPGDRLQDDSGSVYEVIYTEVDPTDDKPPKLTLETI